MHHRESKQAVLLGQKCLLSHMFPIQSSGGRGGVGRHSEWAASLRLCACGGPRRGPGLCLGCTRAPLTDSELLRVAPCKVQGMQKVMWKYNA